MHFTFLHKLGASLLISAWLIWGVNFLGDLGLPRPEIKTARAPVTIMAAKPAAEPAQPSPSASSEPATASAGGGVLALLANADVKRGLGIFKKCKACHTVDEGGKNKVGPNLWEVVGGAKAGVEGYKYSGVLKSLGGDWTYQDLDGFLTKPKKFAPGTKMSFSGLKKEADRADLIAYLRSLSASPRPLP